MRFLFLALLFLAVARPAAARDVFFTASDGARLHYTESGPPGAPILVFVPGWTMPGWIFALQQQVFDKTYQVVLFDPRGQGISEITPGGYDQDRRGADIGELLARLPGKIVLVGWSLGVLDALAYIHQSGGFRLAGLVLIDNSVGENPPPLAYRSAPRPALSRDAAMRAFVAGMFHTRQSPAYLDRLTAVALRVPPADAEALLNYDVPRSYWKAALLSTDMPVLYVVRPHLQAQADHLLIDRPNTSIAVFSTAGHALFVDDANRFDTLMEHFLTTNVWQ
jgi:non-heme chloroperoxidase